MTKNTTDHAPVCGSDLERWRLQNGLAVSAAAQAFGIHRNKWVEITSQTAMVNPVDDPAVGLLYQLYTTFPATAPIQPPTDVQAVYKALGLSDTHKDRTRFGILLGRDGTSVYRWLLYDGTPGKPVVCWLQALNRLNLTGSAKLELMMQMATDFGKRQGIDNVLESGWTSKESTDE